MAVPIEARALWITGPGKAEIRAEPLPEPRPGEALVRTVASGVSRGTERIVLDGRVPDSVRDAMRAPFQAGDFPFPVKYGYAAVGVVERGPEALAGRTVFCLHPHQDLFVAPSDALQALPDDLPARRGILTANMETALNIVWDAEIAPGDAVTVIGAGVVGLLAAHLARGIVGTDVTIVDMDPAKRDVAERMGLSFRLPEQTPDGQDVAINTSASETGLALAMACVLKEGLIVEASWYGDREVRLPLGGRFHSDRLRLISSQVGQVSDRRSRRWPNRRRLATAVRLLADDRLDHLISGSSPFLASDRDHARVLADPGTLCHVYEYCI